MGAPLCKTLIFKILSWVVLVPSGIALIVFSVINRHAVTVDFWPFDYAPKIRLFVVILFVLAIGVLWGGLAAWLAGGAGRRRGREAGRRASSVETDLRQANKRIQRLESELTDARGKSASAALPPANAA